MSELHRAIHDRSSAFRPTHAPPFASVRARKRTRDRRRTGAAGALAVVAVLGVAFGSSALMGSGIPDPSQQLAADPTPVPSDGGPDASPSAAAADLTLIPERAVQMSGSPSGTPSVDFNPTGIRVGKHIAEPGRPPDDERFLSAALAFPAVDPTLCISRADLTLPGGRLEGRGEVRVYPSAALSLAKERVPPNGERPTTLLDNRPFGFEIVRNGTRTFNVTELVQLWVAGEPFPSKGKSVPEGSPIVLLLRPPAMDPGSYEVQFDILEDPPTLDITTCDSE